MTRRRPTAVALIPARSGSKRVPNKNVRLLAGYPLLVYAIAGARQSGVFKSVVVSTDSKAYASVARQYGAEVPFLRPTRMSGDLSPDIEWVEHALRSLKRLGREFDAFSILRPTSPFRLPETIRRAWAAFLDEPGIDSLRAVQRCREHPGKMWVIRGRRMIPLLALGPAFPPWHSTPYQALPEVYSQNASLEIAWTRVVFDGRTIAGEAVMPFVSQGLEGFDLNYPHDWTVAEELIRAGEAKLPSIT